MRSYQKFIVSLCLLLVITLPVRAQTGAGTDPYGKPLGSREQQRAQLEQLLGRRIKNHLPIQRRPAGRSCRSFRRSRCSRRIYAERRGNPRASHGSRFG